VAGIEIDLADTHRDLVEIEKAIQKATIKHNQFLKDLGLPPLPGGEFQVQKEVGTRRESNIRAKIILHCPFRSPRPPPKPGAVETNLTE
jgi:hypothetical protein